MPKFISATDLSNLNLIDILNGDRDYCTTQKMGLQIHTLMAVLAIRDCSVEKLHPHTYFGIKVDGGNYRIATDKYRQIKSLILKIDTHLEEGKKLKYIIRDEIGLRRLLKYLSEVIGVSKDFLLVSYSDLNNSVSLNYSLEEAILQLPKNIQLDVKQLLELALVCWEEFSNRGEKGPLGESLPVIAGFRYGLRATDPACFAVQFSADKAPKKIKEYRQWQKNVDVVADSYGIRGILLTHDEDGFLCLLEEGLVRRKPEVVKVSLLEIVAETLSNFGQQITITKILKLDPEKIFIPGQEKLTNLPETISTCFDKLNIEDPVLFREIQAFLVMGLHNFYEVLEDDNVQTTTVSTQCIDGRVQSKPGVTSRRSFAGLILQDGFYSFVEGLSCNRVKNFDITAHEGEGTKGCGAMGAYISVNNLDAQARELSLRHLREHYDKAVGDFFAEIPVIEPLIGLKDKTDKLLDSSSEEYNRRVARVFAILNCSKFLELLNLVSASGDELASRVKNRIDTDDLSLRIVSIDVTKTGKSRELLLDKADYDLASTVEAWMRNEKIQNDTVWDRFIEL